MDHTQNNWKRKTMLFLVSQCITLFGSIIVQMSIIWYVTLKTSSGWWVAAFTICSYLPQFLISFFAGVVLSIGTFRATLLIDILTAIIGIGLLSCVLLPKQETLNENVSVLSEIKKGISYTFSDKIIGKILILSIMTIGMGILPYFVLYLAMMFV